MKLSTVVCCLLITALASAENAVDNKDNKANFYALLKCNYPCGGSIVSANRIITTAQCLEFCEPEDMEIYVDIQGTKEKFEADVYGAEQFHIHPNHRAMDDDFNIAVIDVKGSISFKPNVNYIEVAKQPPSANDVIMCLRSAEPPPNRTLDKVDTRDREIDDDVLNSEAVHKYMAAGDPGDPCVFNNTLVAVVTKHVHSHIVKDQAIDLTSPEISDFLNKHL